MAHEFYALPNPDNVPGAVSTGYQRQNTNMFAIQTGLDKTCLYTDDKNKVLLKTGSIIEYNGELFKSTSDIDLTDKINNVFSGSSNYCFFTFDGQEVTTATNKGTLSLPKYARYLGNKRLLNYACRKYYGDWVSGSYQLISRIDVAYGNNVWVMVGTGTALYSLDGINWNPSNLQNINMTCVTFGNGKFVALSKNTTVFVYTSTDGINWSVTGQWSASQYTTPNYIIYEGGKFIATATINVPSSYGVIEYSTNGSSFNGSAAFPISRLERFEVAYKNGIYSIITPEGITRYSTDGITWTDGTKLPDYNWQSITAGGLYFIAIAQNTDAIGISADGITWQVADGRLPHNLMWSSITCGDGMFIAVPYGSSRGATSRDGLFWNEIPIISGGWRRIVYANYEFFLLGSSTGYPVYLKKHLDFGKYNTDLNRYDFTDFIYQLND
jgi:hypothetical protein